MHWAGKECFVKVMQTTKASNFNQKCIRTDERNCEKPESHLAKQHKDTWNRVLSNRRYIKEVRSKFIQFEVLQRHYYTQVWVYKISSLNSNIYKKLAHSCSRVDKDPAFSGSSVEIFWEIFGI